MTLEAMRKTLGMSSVPACFEALYCQISANYESRMAQLLSAPYLEKVLEEGYALVSYRTVILKAAEAVADNGAMRLLVALLEQWLRSGGNLADPAYTPPEGVGIAFDFLHLFPALSTIPESVAHLRRRGVPEDVIAATMGEYDFCVDMCCTRLGRPAFDRGRLAWITRVVRNQMIRIGRFKYDLPDYFLRGFRVYRNREGVLAILADGVEVHRSGRLLGSVGHTDPAGAFRAELQETADAVAGCPAENGFVKQESVTLSKAEWTLCLSGSDAMPRIHIPGDGSFDRETIAASFARARKIFADCYPDYPYRAFFCSSWLMSADLHEILKPTSNILGFQSFFTRIPFISGGKGVFSFVYQLPADIPGDLDALPEDTSLQRAVKARYKNGGYVHEGAGFFF